MPTPHIRRRAAPLLAAVPLFVLATAGPAVAADDRPWTITPSPSPHVATNGLAGVFGRTATDAWAVGVYGNVVKHDANGGLILHWDGTEWTWVHGPNPQFLNERLDSVSGTSANDVWAVGAIARSQSQPPKLPWALHWDGTAWSVVPMPSGAVGAGYGTGGLHAVAAISASNAWTVGKVPSGGALVEHWDGSAWSVASVPATEATAAASLNALAVLSPTNIWAVGSQVVNPNGTKSALILHYDGMAWSVAANQVSVPSNFTSNGLSSITAVGPNDIWAVGNVSDNLSLTQPLIQHWNGTTWTRVPAPARPAGISHFGLSSVAAVSSGDVFAVGSLDHEDLSGSQSWVVHWNGTSWSTVSAPHGGTAGDSLSEIAVTPSGGPIWSVGASLSAGACCGTQKSSTLILRK